MIPHTLLGFYRNLTRHRLYSALNILGLAVGIAVFLVLAQLTRYEFGFDRFWPHADQIYRLDCRWTRPGVDQGESASCSFLAADLLRADYPQIAAATRIMDRRDIVSVGSAPISRDILYVDSDFLDVFPLHLLHGNTADALAAPDRLMLSASTARRLLGTESAVGRTVDITHEGTRRSFTVSAVFRDVPSDSSVDVDMVVPFSPLVKQGTRAFEAWGSSSGETFLRIDRPQDARAIAADLRAFVHRRAAGSGQNQEGANPENHYALSLLPLGRVHFFLNDDGYKPSVDRRVVLSLELVGALGLLMAAVNYVNLATARAGLRAREVAMRKVLGATRVSLMAQFLCESLALVTLSGLVGLALAELAVPAVDALGGWSIRIEYGWALPVLALLVLLLGPGAGLYPAVILAAYRPASVLAASRMPSGGRMGVRIRSLLVLAQFASAIGFAACTLVVDRQTDFLRSADRGFERSGLVIVKSIVDGSLATRQIAILDAFRRIPGVDAVTVSDREPASNSTSDTSAYLDGQSAHQTNLTEEWIGRDYQTAYRARLVAGRWFDDAHRQDDRAGQPISGRTISTMINQQAVSTLGFANPQAAIGHNIFMDGAAGRITLPIIGVVADVRFMSPREHVLPQIYLYDTHAIYAGQAAVRFSGVTRAEIMRRLETSWHAMVPDAPFVADTADERLADYYRPDQQRARLFSIGSGIALAIACVGLYGLAAFTTARRTQEIGIRKVLGASTGSVLALLVGQFLRPVLLAGLIACPLAWLAMRSWLAGFDQRIPLSPGYFLGALLAALALATFTVLAQAIRVARAEPARALRDA